MTLPIVRRFPTAQALLEAGATALALRIAADIAARGHFRLALAGGNTPKLAYERLAGEELSALVDWTRVELFWGDERCVPPDHRDSNYRMAAEALINRVPIADSHVHRIRGEDDPEAAARAYERALGDEPLDLVLLGMGPDGHTASLFPGRPEASERERLAVVAQAPKPPARRVSLSLRALTEARAVWFWVAGADKATRVAQVLGEIASGAPTLPAARVQPTAGELVWFVDDAAAAEI